MPHLLSIQSHVAFGHVGNSAAVFPLQRLGFEVAALNTVQFSNHTGYGEFTGDIFSPSHLRNVLDGMEARGALAKMSALLSGYLGDEHTGAVVLEALQRIKKHNPQTQYCCDPVMGDVGRGFFVKAGLPEWMRDHAIPHADIITPNQFELSFLSGMDVYTQQDVLQATAAVRERGPRLVLVTSVDVAETPDNQIALLLDTPQGAWQVTTPRLDFAIAPNGAGDTTTAWFFAQILRGTAPEQALANTAAAIYALFARTYASGERELQLIDAQQDMMQPAERFTVTRLR